jgi:hypothetical protein
MTLARSSHGTLLAVQLTPGGAFTTIAELGDLSLPETDRNEFDATTQEKDIDAWVLGVLRRGAYKFPINLLPNNNTHDHLTGLQKLQFDNTVTGWRVTVPAISGGDAGIVWIMSGQVKTMSKMAPTDGKLAGDVTLRFSGAMSVGGVTIGG